MIKAVLFDLDGTLVDSLEDLSDCANAALKEYGYNEQEPDKYRYFVGNGIPKMLSRASGETDSEKLKLLYDKFIGIYSEHYCDKTYAYDGMRELVNNIKALGLTVAVITNKDKDMADVVVEKLYGDVFDLVFGRCDGIPPKPDPTAVFMAMAEIDVNPDECIFLGDSDVDIVTAVNSGAIPIGELWGYRDREELAGAGARFIIEKPCELLELVKELNK